MDNIFYTRVLTSAVNAMNAPYMTVYNRVFRDREHLEPSDRLAFDVISGAEAILSNVSVMAPAAVTEKTGRKTISMTAPRLAHKRFIHTSELNALRGYGQTVQTEMIKQRVAREQRDMKNAVDRTVEFWACGALRGKIYDADLTTVLVDYGVAETHQPVLTGDDRFSEAASKPLERIRAFKQLVEDDAGATITGWTAFVGSAVMDALLKHSDVLELLKYAQGGQAAASGRIGRLAEVDLIEYNASFLHQGVRRRFVEQDEFLLVGHCDDVVDAPFAPVVDDEAPGGVGNTAADGSGLMFFSKSWVEKDPSGRWIKVEARPLPVLQRPGAVVAARVV
jgi:hypothetical protein